MAKKQIRHLDTSWDTEPTPEPEPQEPEDAGAVEMVDTTTEQPIAVDVLEPVVTYTPPDDPLIAVRLELPMTALFALIEMAHPLSDILAADYYGLVLLDGSPSPIGQKVLAGVDQTLLRHKLNAAARIAHNQRIDRGA